MQLARAAYVRFVSRKRRFLIGGGNQAGRGSSCPTNIRVVQWARPSPAPPYPEGLKRLLAVTTRTVLKDRLSGIAARLELPPPRFFPSVHSVLAARALDPLLFLDLGSCCDDSRLESAIREWEAMNSLSEIVFYVPLIDRERETRRLFGLASLGAGRVMTESDFSRLEVWRTLKEAHTLAELKNEIREEFLAAVGATGRRLRAEPIVLQLLSDAPKVTDLNETIAAALRNYRPNTEATRKAVWTQLRRADQMPASWLLLTFRILWHTKLQERGWNTGRIAPFMSFRTARDFRRALRRRAGISMSELKKVGYAAALEWAARVSTGGYGELAGSPVSRMIQPLLTRETPVSPSESKEVLATV